MTVETSVLASLEQYILVNRSNFQCGAADLSTTIDPLIITGVVVPTRKISKPLSYQILKFCRSYGTDVAVHGSQTINEKVITELVAAGDNHAAAILGPALTDYDEGANTGESLIFVLLPYYFYLRRLSDQKSREHKELNCSTGFLMSIMAVLEGLVFYSDIRVAMNCGLCLSMVLGWENLDLQEKRIIAKSYWYRPSVEEMALSLAAPCLASKSFFNLHKPAVNVAVALPKLDNTPLWLRTVFDDSCVGARNVSKEMVLLFRELLNSDFLKADQIASLNHVLQACRKDMYSNSACFKPFLNRMNSENFPDPPNLEVLF
ncbi:hypothetical protein Patl1_26175 [Pistacia atlantica]|uniref:Uncharacterized protein n=1 Tax=Pistacia atlantica TaxID=434234 RepID=A0ACC1B2I6_9ROSI|nr:hypothetical protein Patl1_26175 [Pistacia atlantica]